MWELDQLDRRASWIGEEGHPHAADVDWLLQRRESARDARIVPSVDIVDRERDVRIAGVATLWRPT